MAELFRGIGRDDITEAGIIIDFPHHEVHEGDMYCAWVYQDNALNAGQALEMVFKTPAVAVPPDRQKRCHMIIEANATAQSVVALHQISGTITDGVDFGEPVNRRDDQPHNSALQAVSGAAKVLVSAPTLAAISGVVLGSLRSAEQFGTRTTGAAVGSRAQNEHILKPGQLYRLSLTSGAAGNVAWLGMCWYEHTDG